MELFNTMAGVKTVHIPYKGVNLAMQDVLSGNVHLVFIGIPAAAPVRTPGRFGSLRQLVSVLEVPWGQGHTPEAVDAAFATV